jgi:hypothetical protein
MATAPTTAGTTWDTLGAAIVNAIKNVIGNDWSAIQQGATAAAKALASVSMDMADPNNTMTPDEKLEIMDDYKDSLRNALLYGTVVTKVVVKQAIDAAVQAIVSALPALVGIA